VTAVIDIVVIFLVSVGGKGLDEMQRRRYGIAAE